MTKPDWKTSTNEFKEKIVRDLIGQGHTAKYVSEQFLNATRHSVKGFCNKRKIELISQQVHREKKKAQRAIKRANSPTTANVPTSKPTAAATKRDSLLGGSNQISSINGSPKALSGEPYIKVISSAFMCKWPLWEEDFSPTESLCCGKAKSIDTPYCDEHLSQASYRRLTP